MEKDILLKGGNTLIGWFVCFFGAIKLKIKVCVDGVFIVDSRIN